MVSMPIFAVPKPSGGLRLVTNHSYGPHSLNSLIPRENISGAPLDGLRQLGDALLKFQKLHGPVPVNLFKSDVHAAYRLMPVAFEWQIKQVNTVDNSRHIDRCTCFGDSGSAKTWIDFNACVLWIAVFIKLIPDLFAYSDDTFSFDFEVNMSWYAPYKKFLPAKQVQLLLLWDELGIPHEEKKQVFGRSIKIIGFDVNTENMTITMAPESKADLLKKIQSFISGLRFTLRDFQSLTGHINWSFNVFPLLRPSLSNIYHKIASASHPRQFLWMNNDMKCDLRWLSHHIESSSGINVLASTVWDISDADSTVFCDASLKGLGFWYPELSLGFFAPVNFNLPHGTGIYFLEALCVASAIHNFKSYLSTSTAVIYTDSENTVDMFNSFRATPPYNPILTSAVDEIIQHSYDIRVLHIAGDKNDVADALSRGHFDHARQLVPGLIIEEFVPPQDILLSIHKFLPPRNALGEYKK